MPEENKTGCSSGKQKRRKKQKSQHHKLLSELLLDFAKNTTLHGLRYVTERGLSAVEKLFWMITFLISLCVCIWLMGNVWVKWQNNPIIVTLSEKLIPVEEVPFPAVTVCPQAKIEQKEYNYTDQMIKYYTLLFELNKLGSSIKEAIQNVTQQHTFVKKLHDITLICADKGYKDDKTFVLTDHTAVQNIKKVAPYVFHPSTWRGEKFEGCELFYPVLTHDGICFTFNSLASNEIFNLESIQRNYSYSNASTPRKGWSLEHGYSNSSSDTYPRRGRANSAEPDLQMNVEDIEDRDVLCDGFNRGFKVYLHHPADLPQSSLYYYAVLPGQVISFAIKVNIMKTSQSLVNYSPQIRQCYFPLEKKLRYFRLYTLNNCRLECSANYTLKRCGCVWFHMPHNDSMTLCKYSMVDCFTRALGELASEDALCQCLPSCDSVEYEADVIQTQYNAHNFYKVNNAVWDKVWLNVYNKSALNPARESLIQRHTARYAKIEMYFKEPKFVSMRRSELFGLTDFLANCGGLLGLFLGFSFLSLVEIFYFFTLRLSCKLRNNTTQDKNMKADRLKTV